MLMRIEEETSKIDGAEGRLTLPASVRETMGVQAGDVLEASLETQDEAGGMVLKLRQPGKKWELKSITDPNTGWPVLSAGAGAPILTSEMVAELLTDFP